MAEVVVVVDGAESPVLLVPLGVVVAQHRLAVVVVLVGGQLLVSRPVRLP